MIPKTVSVIIPSLGRTQELFETLSALEHQSLRPLEIVVVDQNQPPLDLRPYPLVRQVLSSVPGYVLNCNKGLCESRGDVVLFLDDDILPTTTLIEEHLKTYDKLSVQAVAGRVEQAHGDPVLKSRYPIGAYRRFTGKVIPNFHGNRSEYVDLVQGCNMSFLRDALHKIGGFDAGFVGNGFFSETDMALRFRAAGNRIFFNAQASLKHLQAPRGGCRIQSKSEFNYFWARNGARLFRRHSPRIARPLYVLRTVGLLAARAAKNRDPRILQQGWLGLRDGFRNHVG